VAADTVGACSRAAGVRHLGDRAAAAKLVRVARPRGRWRSVFPDAGSNVGSLLALLAYPLLVERALPLDRQAWLWSCGFGALALGIALCAGATVCGGRRGIEVLPRDALASGRLRERLTWIALAFVPSSLLLGVTTHITMDIAAVPLLWVVPLMLYLLTFILTFALARRCAIRQWRG
jgi:hypothetical protein